MDYSHSLHLNARCLCNNVLTTEDTHDYTLLCQACSLRRIGALFRPADAGGRFHLLCRGRQTRSDRVSRRGGVPGRRTHVRISGEYQYRSFIRVGAYLRLQFGRLEHTFAFSSDFLFPKDVEGPTDAKGIIYNSNLIVTIPLERVEPYLTAGIGLVHQYGSPDLPVGTEPALNYGGGVKVPRVKGPFGLRFDIRGYRVGFVTNSVNMLEMSGGIMISTGR